MLLTVAIILVVLWALGLITHIAAGFIHLLLVVALIVAVVHFLRGARPV